MAVPPTYHANTCTAIAVDGGNGGMQAAVVPRAPARNVALGLISGTAIALGLLPVATGTRQPAKAVPLSGEGNQRVQEERRVQNAVYKMPSTGYGTCSNGEEASGGAGLKPP